MSKVEQRDGKWFAIDGERTEGPFDTNSQAWRAMDRLAMEPVNREENTTDWRLTREMRGQ